MLLTPNFSLRELTRTDTGLDNSPTTVHKDRLTKLAQFLEKVRTLTGNGPIIVHSAYRSDEVNEVVGGVKNSAHAKGWAGDISSGIMSAKALAKLIAASPLKFDQLILEVSRGVVHVSIDPAMRMQILTQPKGPGTPFKVGLPK